MKFLVDAQLPRRLVLLLGSEAHDARHTLNLRRGNTTPDAELCDICQREQRVLVTKDLDFTDSFMLKRRPARLLLISTGNISNRELETLVRARLPDVEAAFASSSFIELDRGRHHCSRVAPPRRHNLKSDRAIRGNSSGSHIGSVNRWESASSAT